MNIKYELSEEEVELIKKHRRLEKKVVIHENPYDSFSFEIVGSGFSISKISCNRSEDIITIKDKGQLLKIKNLINKLLGEL